MKNKTLIIILFCVCAINSFLSAKESLIVFTRSSNAGPYEEALNGFKKALDKENATYRLLEYDLQSDLEKMFQETGKPDLILTIGSKATKLVADKIKNIPIVFSMLLSFSVQQSNLSGVSLETAPLNEFKMLKKIVPSLRRVGLIYNPAKTKHLADKGRSDAQGCGLEIVSMEVSSAADVYSAVRIICEKVDVLWMIPDFTVYSQKSTEDFLLQSLREKKPVIGLSPSYVESGALFSLSCDYLDIGRQSGEIAWQIIQGRKPAEIPVVTPRKTKISLNLITAERMGIKIPKEIIDQAVNIYK